MVTVINILNGHDLILNKKHGKSVEEAPQLLLLAWHSFQLIHIDLAAVVCI